MNQPATPDNPRIVLKRTEDYRDSYANSIQVRLSVWDFLLVFGTLSTSDARAGRDRKLPGHLSQPAAGQGVAQHPRCEPRAVRADLRPHRARAHARKQRALRHASRWSGSLDRSAHALLRLHLRPHRRPAFVAAVAAALCGGRPQPPNPAHACPITGTRADTTFRPRWTSTTTAGSSRSSPTLTRRCQTSFWARSGTSSGCTSWRPACVSAPSPQPG